MKPKFTLEKQPEVIGERKNKGGLKYLYHLKINCNSLTWVIHVTIKQFNNLESKLSKDIPGYVKQDRKAKQLKDSVLEDNSSAGTLVDHLNDMGRSKEICQS